MFFLFFREKKRKNQRKETLSGWELGESNRAALSRLARCGGGGVFFLFFREKKRKNQRKETLSGGFARSPAGRSARIAKKPVGERGGCSFPRFARAVFPCPAFAQGGKGRRCEEMFMRRESL